VFAMGVALFCCQRNHRGASLVTALYLCTGNIFEDATNPRGKSLRRGVLPIMFPSSEFPSLSERDRQLLRALVQGKSNAQIADEMCLAQQSVKNYLSQLYLDLGVRSRTEAAVWAIQNGIDSDEPEVNGHFLDVEPHDPPAQTPTVRTRALSPMRVALFTLLFLSAVSIGAYIYASAQKITYGESTISIPATTENLIAVEAYLRVKFGDEYNHWIEEIEVGYPDGSTSLEPRAFFSFPTPIDKSISDEITRIVMNNGSLRQD